MSQRRVLLAVSGGIAAYKVPELVRALVRDGHAVRCATTRNAAQFVAPLVLQTLSGEAVRSDLFDPEQEGRIDHIELADWADVVVVAPATADVLAKMAHGIADDLVTTLLLATRAPVVVAPAMNVNMWEHPATRANVAALRARGVRMVGPDVGSLACGWEGLGRMSEPTAIAAEVERALASPTLAGEVLVVTAGGTREPLDPVRVLANRSSGKMGFEIAAEAARRGADVVLVAGPASLPTPAGVRRVDVETALEMRDAVHAELARCTVFVAAAAVADFRPAMAAKQKIKKEALGDDAGMVVELVRNPDILAEVGRAGAREAGARSEPQASEGHRAGGRERRLVIGFAAESEDVIGNAKRKLERKRCDLVVANDIARRDAGFDVDTNVVHFVWPDREPETLPLLAKRDVAARLLDRVEMLRRGA